MVVRHHHDHNLMYKYILQSFIQSLIHSHIPQRKNDIYDKCLQQINNICDINFLNIFFQIFFLYQIFFLIIFFCLCCLLILPLLESCFLGYRKLLFVLIDLVLLFYMFFCFSNFFVSVFFSSTLKDVLFQIRDFTCYSFLFEKFC